MAAQPPPTAARQDAAKEPAPPMGRTASGKRFVVPVTHDIFESIMDPRCWGISEVFTVVVLLFHCSTLLLLRTLPIAFYVAQFLSYRIGYNLLLGVILHFQSHESAVTKWLSNARPETRKLIKRIVSASMGSDYSWNKVPIEFNAWLVFRVLAMHILANDGLTYLILAAKLMHRPSYAPIYLVLGVVACVATAALSFWSKMAAHNILGDFAWNWGDFFFLMEGDLTFDGVFEYFPHPMYTVGYVVYYGISLLTRSYTMLVVSLIAHGGQMLFLFLVEEPHIRRTYSPCGTELPETDTSQENQTGRSPLSLPSVASLVLFVAITLVSQAFLRVPVAFCVLQLLLWRVCLWVGCSLVLAAQSRSAWWTAFCGRYGLSSAEAFREWVRQYAFVYAMNHVAFLILAWRMRVPVSGFLEVFYPQFAARMLGAGALLAIAVYGMTEAYDVLGVFGMAYGDFFLEPQDKKLQYTGVFRYLNNPDCMLGYCGHYGVSLFSGSWFVFFVAVITQIANLVFIQLVEIPHMSKTYSNRRSQIALRRAVVDQFDKVASIPAVERATKPLREQAARGRQAAGANVIAARQRTVEVTQQISEGGQAVLQNIHSHNLSIQGRATTITEQARTRLMSLDSEVVDFLNRKGLGDKLFAGSDDDEIEAKG